MTRSDCFKRLVGAASVAAVTFLVGCATSSPAYDNQTVFKRAEDAAVALASAVKADDAAALEAIFGESAREALSSGDPVADRMQREVFSVAISEGWTLERIDAHTRELVVGHEHWPFPIPLVHDRRGWWFDTAAGVEEILARRVGRNELAAIGTLRTYVLAQREYASTAHDGQLAGAYAMRVRSDPGTRNGLYWPQTSPSDPPSPLGELAAAAVSEGYGTQSREGAAPFRGYYFRILTRQGPDAFGGEKNYVVNGRLTGGFAMIAHPAEYGSSGIMTLLVGPDGVVYETDLGENTSDVVATITQYNPDGAWSPVQ